MATAADVQALEASCPWLRDDFRADLAQLTSSTADAARRYAADARVIARLAAQVPRCAADETGATPWTSFRREVAVARRVSDRAAAAEIRAALRLTTVLPRTLALLEEGRLTVPRAKALVTEVEVYDDALAAELDRSVADRAVLLPPHRIVQELRRAAATLDPEAAGLRTAAKNAARGVTLHPDRDDQAVVSVVGPAVPLTRWYAGLDQQARALKRAGDPRTLDALRFDLVTSAYPCAVHRPADGTAPDSRGDAAPDTGGVLAGTGLRPSFVEAADTDCRRSRPVQAVVAVPVETALGLSNEPAWLDGYGWLSAPTTRELLVDAELRRLCVQVGTGQPVDLETLDRRPPPTPAGLREGLLATVLDPVELSDVGWRSEPRHDPSPALRQFVELRDRACDGPTGRHTLASRCELDHEQPYPAGATAAWNLTARATRTHQLKHHGWTPLRTATSTLWFSPAGQLVEVPRHGAPPPGIDGDGPAALPDADLLAEVDHDQTTVSDDDLPPWLAEQDTTAWTWLSDVAEPAPF